MFDTLREFNNLIKLHFMVKDINQMKAPHLHLSPAPLLRPPPTSVCSEGRAQRLSCCLLGPLRPPGMSTSGSLRHRPHVSAQCSPATAGQISREQRRHTQHDEKSHDRGSIQSTATETQSGQRSEVSGDKLI